jgi:hypothetical protein
MIDDDRVGCVQADMHLTLPYFDAISRLTMVLREKESYVESGIEAHLAKRMSTKPVFIVVLQVEKTVYWRSYLRG